MPARHDAPAATSMLHASPTAALTPVGGGTTVGRRPSPAVAAAAPPRRITIVTSATAWGGAELQATALAGALAARGHRVSLVELGGRWFDRAEVRAVPGLRVAHVPGPSLREMRGRDAFRALQEFAGDLCVLSKPSFGVHALAVDAAARLLFRRYVRWEHHPAPALDARPPVRLAAGRPRLGLWWHAQRLRLRLHARAAHRVVTVSDVVRDRLADAPGFDPARTVRVHCGIDTEAFAATPERRWQARATLGLAPEAVVVGAIGRVAANKRHDLALHCFRDLVAASPARPLHFVLGGEGPELPRLRALAAELGIADRTRFTGHVPRATDVLHALDVFVMPSQVEGLGIALIEAMASGCACVAMHSGGPAEILRDPAHGWLVPADDEAAFGRALAAAVDEPAADRQRRAEHARAHVERHFSAARQLEQLADAVERA